MLKPLQAELAKSHREFAPVARAAVVAVPAPVRVAGWPGSAEDSGPRLPRPSRHRALRVPAPSASCLVPAPSGPLAVAAAL